MRLMIDNWRWAGVPFYLRTGKALAARRTEIAIKFRSAPLALFRDMPVESLAQNLLMLRIQPDEGAALHFNAKIPGPDVRIENVRMNFKYEDYFDAAPSTGYETLIYDCMIGDAMLFQRANDIEAGWRVVDPILQAWREAGGRDLQTYPAGSDGPKAAELSAVPRRPTMAADHMSVSAASQTRIFDTPEQLAQQAADWIVEQASKSRTRFALCLSGGETPQRLYELLATPAYRARIPWDRTHCFWGDERVVPHDDSRSNFHMAWEALLRHVPIPAENIHAIPTERMGPAAGAAAYAATLKRFYGADTLDAGRPLFDLTLLGLGEDGHIASLFPGSPALAETERWAVAVIGETPPDRITLTYPVLASSNVTAFLVAGERKRDGVGPRTRWRPGAAGVAIAAGRRRSIGSSTAQRPQRRHSAARNAFHLECN